jgi:hypothetical protein
MRHQLMQQPKPLGFQRVGQNVYACHVSARPAVARHEPQLDWIAADGEDDRDRRGRGLGRERRRVAAGRNYHGHRPACEFCRQRRQSIVVTLRPAVFDRHVPAFGITVFEQSLTERGHQMGAHIG